MVLISGFQAGFCKALEFQKNIPVPTTKTFLHSSQTVSYPSFFFTSSRGGKDAAPQGSVLGNSKVQKVF